jgi:hypothetical protein
MASHRQIRSQARSERERNVEKREGQMRYQLENVVRENIGQEPANVAENGPSYRQLR